MCVGAGRWPAPNAVACGSGGLHYLVWVMTPRNLGGQLVMTW